MELNNFLIGVNWTSLIFRIRGISNVFHLNAATFVACAHVVEFVSEHTVIQHAQNQNGLRAMFVNPMWHLLKILRYSDTNSIFTKRSHDFYFLHLDH